ncbi:hypothetical protein EYF80_025578 [Liparis tanakae]|uniref:Uncharacterized protein n=1 Tax=Liparis tanakae TaxID=230148 RepID=A0A4Z2HF82_9TELE|nr:hypothetical protein EYF80_025578 [Liparis tanakae]
MNEIGLKHRGTRRESQTDNMPADAVGMITARMEEKKKTSGRRVPIAYIADGLPTMHGGSREGTPREAPLHSDKLAGTTKKKEVKKISEDERPTFVVTACAGELPRLLAGSLCVVCAERRLIISSPRSVDSAGSLGMKTFPAELMNWAADMEEEALCSFLFLFLHLHESRLTLRWAVNTRKPFNPPVTFKCTSIFYPWGQFDPSN